VLIFRTVQAARLSRRAAAESAQAAPTAEPAGQSQH